MQRTNEQLGMNTRERHQITLSSLSYFYMYKIKDTDKRNVLIKIRLFPSDPMPNEMKLE